MAREYIFRVWDDSNKQMISHENIECSIKNINKQGRYYNHHLHFMQSTGLKDKNGKEVFEGDIFLEHDRYAYFIKWHDGGFMYNEGENRGWYFYQGKSEIIEIIGNIYENPYLITL